MESDPRFPKRPETPEFEKIAAIFEESDHHALEEVLTFEEMQALAYIAKNRVIAARGIAARVGTKFTHEEELAGCYFDAFFAGMRYGR